MIQDISTQHYTMLAPKVGEGLVSCSSAVGISLQNDPGVEHIDNQPLPRT